MLQDGRILLVEYKGQHLLSSDDTKEKCNIGELWASKSGGKGLFMLVSEGEAGLRFERQMMKQGGELLNKYRKNRHLDKD